ncbi:MAG TPA: lysylphosphatidylglycerol synthase transmembrane domain-containing protein [Acidimicrobiales bacterium]|nr:lysylphosphatidylglycerol synthase transmembrane domain-containing protein [Acidimicrobiales bacterium]
MLVPAVAVVLLWKRLSHSSAALSAIGEVDPAWLVGVIGLALSGYVLSSIGLRTAADRSLPLGRTIGVQLAAAFANRVTIGGTGGLVTNVRYLERSGSTRTEAMSALSLQWVVRLLVHLVAIVAVGSLAHSRLPVRWSPPDPPDAWLVVGAPLAAAAVVVMARWGIPLCRRLMAQAAAVAAMAVDAARDPRRMLVLVGCATGTTAASVAGLVVSLHAVGVSPSPASVATVYLASSAAAALIPTPGGIGAVEAALVAGLVSLGIGAGPALSGVLVFRLVTYLIGLVPGGIAYRVLAARSQTKTSDG